MNNNAKLWVETLRGGSYQQTSGRLRQPSKLPWGRDAVCAMGVLYDLYLKSHKEQWPKSTHGRLPVAALAWAGISRRLEETVIMHNDMRTNFRDIASIIEAHFARLAYRQRSDDAAYVAKQAIEKAQHSSRHADTRISEPDEIGEPVLES